MTPDQAITLISKALNCRDDDQFVNDITRALDALGLLAFASNPQAHGEAANPEKPTPIEWASLRNRP